MGQRGFAPKPTRLEELQGRPGKRAPNRNEPQPAQGPLPRAPQWLSEEAKREWRRVARQLHAVGLLTTLDGDALAVYCETFATWKRAEGQVRAKGEVVETTNGNIIQNPYLGIANRAKRDALTLMREFGMTPSARTRISVEKPDEADALARALWGDG